MLLVLLVAGGFYCIREGWIGYMPPLDELQSPISKYASQIITSDGKVIGTWSRNENRVFVDYDSISPYVFQALVATEDVRFYEHSGIDVRALGRAIVKRGLLRHHEAGGGSTITQQLAKQLYSSTTESTTRRLMQKPIEWVIAVELERHYTKEEILTLYLNYFDFLHNAVGIKTAAQVYFNKQPRDLTITEAATLIGMCKNPSYFNPVREPERCRERRNVVLHQMLKAGYITDAEYAEHCEKPLALNFHRVDHKDGQAAYLREYLRRIMMAKEPNKADYRAWQQQQYYADSLAWAKDPLYGWCNKNFKKDGTPYDIYVDGLKVYTTIDSRMQRYAEEAVRGHVGLYLQKQFEKERASSPNFPYASSLSSADVKRSLQRAMQQTDRTKKQQKRIPQITTRLEQIDKVLNKLYEDNALGAISQDRYEQMSQKYSEEYYTLKAELATLQEQLSAYENAGGRAQKFLKLTERHAAFTELTPAILNEFISRIEVHERDQKRARYAIQHISIYFNYIGKFENEVTQLAEPTEQEIRQMREEIEEAKKEKSRAYHRQYSREYRARNLEKQREYDRMKAREYRARRKAQAAAAQPTQ